MPAAERVCTIAVEPGDEQRALADWLVRNPVPEGFTCPSTLRVVQREPWYVADGDLTGAGTDDVGGPTRRTVVGRRVFFWGVDPVSGDSLLVSLGELDAAKLAAAKQRVADEAEDDHVPDFEEDEQRLAGPWRGLSFVARPAGTARTLRAWLAEFPAGAVIESYPIGWERALDERELAGLPRLIHGRGPQVSTLCVETTSRRGCWSTSSIEIDEARPEPSDDEFAGGSAPEEFPPVELTVWTGRRLERWQLDPAGQWSVVGSASTRRGRVRPGAGSRRFEPAAVAPFRGEFPALWLRSLGADWLVAGEFGSGSQGLVRDATWLFHRHASGWQFGALDGDDVRAHVEWPEDAILGLVLGSHERMGGDGLAYADGKLSAFTVEGEWLRPAGRLPLPTRGMAMLRTAGGWEYVYSLIPKPSRCLAVAIARRVSWRTDDYGGNRRDFPLRLPMASLQGLWKFGPEGLARGC